MSDEQNNQQFEPAFGRYIQMHSVKLGVKPGYILRKVGQAYMVMPTGPRMKDYKGMITLNETGAFLFKQSQRENVTKPDLIEACKTEYGADDEEAEKAVDAFVQQCAQCGLFELESKIIDLKEQREVSQDEWREICAREEAAQSGGEPADS